MQSYFRLLDKLVNQFPVGMTECDQLRVPLNAYRPGSICACRAFDRFRYAIRGPGDNTQAATWLIDCMTMEAADAGKLCTTD